MKTNWQPPFYFKIFVCFIITFCFLDSLDGGFVQADQGDNQSVADSLRNKDVQAPAEGEVDEQIGADEEPVSSDTDEILQDQSLFGMFFQLFLALGFIVLMIYGLIKLISKRTQSYQNHRTLQNIGGVHIGTNRSIQLVRVGETVLVVGVGESIQLLKEIANEAEVKKILGDYDLQQEGQEQVPSIIQWVKSKLNGQSGKEQGSTIQFQRLLEQQLTDVKKAQKEAHAVIKEKEQI